jgi:nucleotide-binding universal stress UspA family protein
MWQPDTIDLIPMNDITEAIANSGISLLKEKAEYVEKQGVTVETKLVETYSGRIANLISEEAEKWAADLLVMGTHGRKGLDHLLMGSVAEQTLRSAHIPMLLVPPKRDCPPNVAA